MFAYERLTASRRWQSYGLRAFGVAALLVAMGTIASSRGAFFEGNAVTTLEDYARLGESYCFAIIMVELALVMLAAPAAAAGAICVDRSRGTLEHMMATDLSDSEIVLGKLAARLMPILGLIAASMPVLALEYATGRGRPAGAGRRVPGRRFRRGIRVLAGAGALRLGPEAVRGGAGDVYRLGDHHARPLVVG